MFVIGHICRKPYYVPGASDILETVQSLDFSKANEARAFAGTEVCYGCGDPSLGFYLAQKKDCGVVMEKYILLVRYFNHHLNSTVSLMCILFILMRSVL